MAEQENSNVVLSEKARQVLEYLRKRDNTLPPSVREICKDLNIKSTSTTFKCLNELAAAGLIEKANKLNRAISLPGQHAVRVPLIGVVNAGQPILAYEEVETYIPYETSNSSLQSELFALRVHGESMINAGILDGDIIIVRKTPAAENGDIVVALIGEEATVKRFYKENGHFRLQPENDALQPIITDTVAILGRVIALKREYITDEEA